MPFVPIPTAQGPAPPGQQIPGGSVLLVPVRNGLPMMPPPGNFIITEDNSPSPPGDFIIITEGSDPMIVEH